MKVLAVMLALAACGAPAATMRAGSISRTAYPNGKARFEFELRGGLPNGVGRSWHPNGKLALEGTYHDGARHGRFWFYGEDGEPIGQAIYFNNAEVWSSTRPDETPPEEWTKEIPTFVRGAPAGADDPVDPEREQEPQFTTMDRTTVSRAGVQVGVGSVGDLDFGAATRVDLYGHYRRGDIGGFVQVSETHVEATYMAAPFQMAPTATLSGRRTLELGATYHRALRRVGALSARAGLLLPIANDDAAGFVASAAGAAQRPTDAAAAVPSALTLRTGGSILRSRGILVVQVDLGLDWMLGGDEHAFDGLVRGSVGVGIGNRRSTLLVEAGSTAKLSDPGERLQVIALGGALTFGSFALSASLVFGADMALVTTVGRDL